MNQHTLRNTLQCIATQCCTLLHTATHCNTRDTKETFHMNQRTLRNILQHTATHTATHSNTLQPS